MNKNKKVLTVDLDFADLWNKEPAQNVSSSTMPFLPSKEPATVKTSTSSAPILDTSDNEQKKQKTQKIDVTHIITGYQTPLGCNFVCDIFIYDVPVK
ncbi:hypothetical protein RclHR1_29680002 [Rhizophagus clarus]|nr:hypothetical protein RclHR1_29680002 [Rhizophagus clarus]